MDLPPKDDAVGKILHLSDLHLGKIEESQWLDQHKATLAAEDRRAERDLLKEALSSLGEEGRLDEIEAVVITGDLANRADADGFEFFLGVADVLLGHVPASRILVVPGNHDVPKAHGPGSLERYTEFLRVTRERELVTPLLDGIDFEPDGTLTDEAEHHQHLICGSRFTIIPINSSHFCWGEEPLPRAVVDALFQVPVEEIEKATQKLRLFDVPRVSNAQITALHSYLRQNSQAFPDRNVRMAALHHHLLPLNTREELKSFEGLTNLGAVNELLFELGTQAVLHGHKHEAALYWNYLASGEGLEAQPRRMLVTAAPARFRSGLPIGRLLTVGERVLAPEVIIEDIVAPPRRGARCAAEPVGRARLWESIPPSPFGGSEVIAGATVSEVYARVQSRFEAADHGDPLRYLVCEISDASDAGSPPVDYPDAEHRAAWMTDLIDWWQLEEPQLGHKVTFNHGERIYRRWGDQVERAAAVLSSERDPSTTRASILLLDPTTDSSPVKGEFPCFFMVQLQLVRRSGVWRLDCTGLFRKQEMRYWWPINVGELHRVQRAVADLVRLDGQRPHLGVLRTVTAYAVAEGGLPAVAVPAVDRAVDQNPAELWAMAYGLLDPEQVADPAEIRELWKRYLAELRPSALDELPAMSHRGLQTILDFAAVGGRPTEAIPTIEALGELVKFYELFKNPEAADPKTTAAAVAERIEILDERLDELFGRL